MSKPPVPGGTGPASLDDAVTVPRVRTQDVAPSAILLSGSDLESVAVEPSALLLSSSNLESVIGERTSEPVDEALIGKVLSDRYMVHALIGHGGMGAVYRGEQIHLRKRVAIKVLRPDKARMAELAVRFEREAIAGAHVDHPNVVAATDFGKLEDGSQFLILEYVEGKSLKEVMQGGPLPLARVLTISRQIAHALVAVHEKSIVHRDMKPQNIMIEARDQVKLLDFGLAKVKVELLSDEGRSAKPGVALTGKGIVMGTFQYMAPEALRGMEAVDARSDLFALGVVMYEMLAGKRPFEEEDAVQLLKRVRTEDAPPLRLRAPEVSVPPRIEAIVMRLLEREPDRRFGSANELCAALDEAAADLEKPSEKAPEKGPDKASEEELLKAFTDAPPTVPVKALEAAPANAAAPMSVTKPSNVAAPAKAARAAPALVAKLREKRSLVFVAAGVAALMLVVIVIVVAVRPSGPKDAESAAPTTTAAQPAASPTVVPASAPTAIDGMDADAWAEQLKRAAAKRDWRPGAKAFLALARLDPARATGTELRSEVAAIVAGIGFETSFAESDQVFGALENELGSGGLDVLFHVVRTRGGTKASKRAMEILSKPGTMDRATPALRIAFELRRAACPDKRALFARAVAEGDERALDELLITKDARCSNKKDPCCFRQDTELKDTIAKLRARLGK